MVWSFCHADFLFGFQESSENPKQQHKVQNIARYRNKMFYMMNIVTLSYLFYFKGTVVLRKTKMKLFELSHYEILTIL